MSWRNRLAAVCGCVLLLLGGIGGLTPEIASASTCGGSGPYYSAVCADAPLAFYPLADSGTGPGTMIDVSGNGNDGTYGGLPPAGTTSGLSFGVSGPLSATNSPNSGVASDSATVGYLANASFLPSDNSPRTVEAWFRATSNTVVSAHYSLVAWGTMGTNNPYGLVVSQNNIGVDHYNGVETFPASVDLFDGNWHFVALTYDGSVDTAYLDGQQLGTPQAPVNGALTTQVRSTLLIGDWIDHLYNSALTGEEADAAIFGSALTATQIADQYTAAGTASTVEIRGSVQDPSGDLVASAPLQACPATGNCVTGSTDISGNFAMDVPAPATGTLNYTLTAYPPSFGTDSDLGSGSATATVSATTGATGVTIALGSGPQLSSGVTIVSPNFGTEGSSTTNPVTYWGSPFDVCASPASLGVQAGGAVTLSSVLVSGINSATAQPETIEFPAGGTVIGLNEPIGPATSTSPPLCVTVPALEQYGMHGSVSFSFQGQLYPDGNQAAPITGIAAPTILDFGADPPDNTRNAYIVNTGLGQINVGGSGNQIVGGDAADFKILPLAQAPSSVSDCGTSQTLLLQNSNLLSSTPSAGSQCGIQVEWDPPANVAGGTSTLEVKVGNSYLAIELLGCNEKLTICHIDPPEDDEPEPSPPPPPPPPPPGPNPQANPNPPTTPGGYVDPSGTVEAQVGSGSPRPLAGATVTLLTGAGPSGPFDAVPNGSAIMSPANRQNPSATDAQGAYGWDTLAGYYEISAADSADGCTPATTSAFTVPPPQTNLNLTLSCGSLPARAATSLGLAASASKVTLGQSVTLTATLAPAGATGTVEFMDGNTDLGQTVIS